MIDPDKTEYSHEESMAAGMGPGIWLRPGPPVQVISDEAATVFANIHPSVLAQLDRIELMLMAQIHLLTITTGPGRYDAKVSGRCACGWTLSIQGRSHDVQAAHAAHIYELMHPERTTNADG